ncbi:chlorite dismutase [Staphylococcus aureus]|nr:chlorite dismutase [Staphylococcus aureus]
MSQAAETLDGWYSLHLFYAVDWASLRLVPKDERDALVTEFQSFLENTATVRSSKSGDQAIYNITKILMRTLISKQDYTQNYHILIIFVSIQ